MVEGERCVGRDSVSAVWITTAAVSADLDCPLDTGRREWIERQRRVSDGEPVGAADLARQRGSWRRWRSHRPPAGPLAARCRRSRRGARSGRPGRTPSARHARGIHEHGHFATGSPSADDGPGAAHTQPSSTATTVGPVECDVPATGDPEQRIGPRACDEGSTGARWHRPRTARKHRRPVTVDLDLPAFMRWRLRCTCCGRRAGPSHRARRPGRRAGRRTGRGRRAANPAASGAPGGGASHATVIASTAGNLACRTSWSAPVIAKRSSVAAASVSRSVRATGATAIDHDHAMAELSESSGDRRAGRSRRRSRRRRPRRTSRRCSLQPVAGERDARPGQPGVGADAVLEPAADVVARRATTVHHLVMAAPAAEVPRPATATRLLAVDVPIRAATSLAGRRRCRCRASPTVRRRRRRSGGTPTARRRRRPRDIRRRRRTGTDDACRGRSRASRWRRWRRRTARRPACGVRRRGRRRSCDRAAPRGPPAPTSPTPVGDDSIGDTPTLWNPSANRWSTISSMARLSGVTVTRADTCMRCCRASSGRTRSRMRSYEPRPLRNGRSASWVSRSPSILIVTAKP